MGKRLFITLMIWGFFLTLAMSSAQAQNFSKNKQTDKNKQTTEEKKEVPAEKSRLDKKRAIKRNWLERMADTDCDGRVDRRELNAWKKLEKEVIDANHDGEIDAKERRAAWRHAASCAVTDYEKGFDEDADGRLSTDEERKLLWAGYAVIRTNGRAPVETDIDAQYDTNNDGVIDSEEGKILKEDLTSG